MSWDDIPTQVLSCSEGLLKALKTKDPYTYYHCLRVGRLSRKLAKAMGLNEFERGILEISGLLHDIGKVSIPDHILQKPGRLTDEEMLTMRSHADLSADLLIPYESTPFFKLVIPGVKYHHERIDGEGYPHAIKGDDLPLTARIISITDTFDAMVNTRPYRTAQPMERVESELIKFSGTQFDAQIVKIFLELLPYLDLQAEEPKDSKEEVAVQFLFKAA